MDNVISPVDQLGFSKCREGRPPHVVTGYNDSQLFFCMITHAGGPECNVNGNNLAWFKRLYLIKGIIRLGRGGHFLVQFTERYLLLTVSSRVVNHTGDLVLQESILEGRPYEP